MSAAPLSLERFSYTYPGAPRPALSDLSLTLGDGELCVLAGRSACGKTTLLRAACGLVPHFHGGSVSGSLAVCGLDVRERGPDAIAARAGTLFQDPETQVVMTTVRAELALPLENRGHSPAQIARGVEEVALALGIAHLLDRPTAELSGGELQRVALGAALAGRPQLVLLDEPTSQLDPVAGDELISLLRRLNEEWGTTVLLIEQRLERCLAAADRVIALEEGRLACDGSVRDFLDWAEHAAPELRTPAARLFSGAGLRPPPAGVKEARATLRAHGLLADPAVPDDETATPRRRRGWRRRREDAALRLERVWYELPGARAILRGVELELLPGEMVALIGRNGAGKSTMLRHIAGLLEPTRGRVEVTGQASLLLQNPGDYFLAERVDGETTATDLERFGLRGLESRHPRELSGGQQQRLALAIVCAGQAPAVLCLDEPTRGMDRGAKSDLAEHLHELSGHGTAVLVATHDAEFAAAVAQRVVLLADGRVIADGSAQELLAGGWYFATETARVLGGAALLPDDGALMLRRRLQDAGARAERAGSVP